MNLDNFIVSKYRELLSFSNDNDEFSDLYESFEKVELRELFSTLHYNLISLFRKMNENLPTGENTPHFRADLSRLLKTLLK